MSLLGNRSVLCSQYLDHYVQCTNIMFKRFFRIQDPNCSHLTLKRPFTRPGPTYLKMPSFHTDVLRRKLNDHPEQIVRLLQLRVNENMTSSKEIRVGSKGSLAIAKQVGAPPHLTWLIYKHLQGCSGNLKGFWYNFETNESGDMMDLVRSVRKIHSEQVGLCLAHFLGVQHAYW